MALSKDQIASRYGTALFGFAQDQDCLEQLHREVAVLLTVLQENPDFMNMLSDPILDQNEKRHVLDSVIGQFSTEMQGFLRLLLEYKRFDAVIDILKNFNSHYDRLKKIAHGKAISAVKLSDEQLQKVSQAYADKYGLQELQLTNEIKPEILGGLILQVGDRRIDGSIQTKLEQIRTQLTAK